MGITDLSLSWMVSWILCLCPNKMSLRPMTSVAQALQSENSLRDSVKTIEKAVQKRWFRTRSPYHELRKVANCRLHGPLQLSLWYGFVLAYSQKTTALSVHAEPCVTVSGPMPGSRTAAPRSGYFIHPALCISRRRHIPLKVFFSAAGPVRLHEMSSFAVKIGILGVSLLQLSQLSRVPSFPKILPVSLQTATVDSMQGDGVSLAD
ncbi:hypothetical protein VTN96DRAFT_3217 [Rasamsonia emersonii]